jgi:glyoxylase-like metal-dependent hydrolase (beta-lactamase superfamily II)
VSALPAGLHRLGDPPVNCHLVEEGRDLTLVDAGLSAHLPGLTALLARLGRRLTDIRAVLVTHGHPDHTGLAAHLAAHGAEVWVHEADEPILCAPRRTGRHWKPERSLARYALRRPAALRAPLHLARSGALRVPPVTGARTFRGGEVLDVPGRPLVVHTPGHTAGSSTFLLPDRAVAFTGDALVTDDSVTGRTGPCLICRAFTADSAAALASVGRIGALDAGLLLTGHGEARHGPAEDAAARALAAGLR